MYIDFKVGYLQTALNKNFENLVMIYSRITLQIVRLIGKFYLNNHSAYVVEI